MIRSTYQCDLCGETFQDYNEADTHSEMHPYRYDMKIVAMSEYSKTSGLPSNIEIEWEDEKKGVVRKMQYKLQSFIVSDTPEEEGAE